MFRRKRQLGWLGIDIGTSHVKIAQLVRDDAGLRVHARSLVPRSLATTEAEDEPVWSTAGEIRTALVAGRDFKGREAATTMPMGFCDIHQIDNPVVDDEDLDSLVRTAIENITQCSAEELEFDIWSAEPESELAEAKRWNVLVAGRPWTDRVYQDVVESGNICHTIDGVPQALARALSLSANGSPLPPVAALDWGYSQATLCVVADGVPAYVRALKDCGFDRVVAAIVDELGVNREEARQLIEAHGVCDLNSSSSDEVSALTAELLVDPLRQLESELTRTLSHVGFQRRTIAPQQLFLFGGGGTIRAVEQHLSRRLRLETHAWRLAPPDEKGSDHDCLFGTALALSALAWSDQ
jgi:Tfp pilus assembly PilM family ATPase